MTWTKEDYKLWRLKNKDKIREYQEKYDRKRRGLRPKRVLSEYAGLCPKDRLRAIKLKVMQHYSGGIPHCSCCGEPEIMFLCIDHIDGNGTEQRKQITKGGVGGNMSYWLLKHNFPDGFQILCYNCNRAKGHRGVCPHKHPVIDTR